MSLADFGIPEHIDDEAFSQILELDDSPENRDFSEALVSAYFIQAKDTFEKMEAAIVRRDLKELSEHGHFLKGSSAALGFCKLKDACQTIQNYGKKMSPDGRDEPNEDVCLQQIKDALVVAKASVATCKSKMDEFFNTNFG